MRGDDSVWSPVRGCWGRTRAERERHGERTHQRQHLLSPKAWEARPTPYSGSSLHQGPVQGNGGDGVGTGDGKSGGGSREDGGEGKESVGVKLVKAHVAGSGEAEDVGVCRPGKSSCEMSER